MSIDKIKKESETHLQNNWTTTPIAWSNVPFDNNPDDYIEPFVLNVSDTRETMGATNNFKTLAIFQINIKRKVGLGTGSLYRNYETLKNLFREQNINDVYYLRTQNASMFQDGDYLVLPLKFECEVRGS